MNGKALRIRDTFVLETPSGAELFKIQEKALSVRDKMEIERDTKAVGVKKALTQAIARTLLIDVEGGEDLKAKGNIVDHEYKIERDGDKVARSRRSGSGSGIPTESRSTLSRTSR